jgi:hypothetical protein
MQSSPNHINTLDLHKVKNVWFAKTTGKLDSLFTPSGLRLIKPTYYVENNKADSLKKDTFCKHTITWLIDNKKSDTNRRDTISSEEWDFQNLEHIGLIDKHGYTNNKYWDTTSPMYKNIVDDNGHLLKSKWDTSTLINLGLFDKAWQPNELEYYRYHNFVDAWFVDNIGSFMIVIERKKIR